MLASVGALTEQLFDYAGIYPPAQLSLADALENHLRYLEGKEAGLVAKFVCGVTRLEELGQLLEPRGLTKAFDLAVVAAPPKDVAEWESTLELAAKTMTAFQNAFGGVASIEAFEIRLPGPEEIDRRLRDLKGFTEAEVFVEVPWIDDQKEILYALSESESYYAKARLGGANADAFPPSDKVAQFISSCLSLELPYKLTAGLHHPYPTVDSATGGTMHGFLNVGVAAGLSVIEDLATKEIQAILDLPATAWRVSGQDLQLLDYRFDVEAAYEARSLFLGIGSCSIEEPLQDLISLGYA
jgi:hypothetical protein